MRIEVKPLPLSPPSERREDSIRISHHSCHICPKGDRVRVSRRKEIGKHHGYINGALSKRLPEPSGTYDHKAA